MQIKLLVVFLFISTHILAQQQSVSPFVAIPAIANEIRGLQNEREVLSVYEAFEKEFPLDNFKQVAFLLDQVNSAVADKLLLWKNPDVIKYILKIQDPQNRNRLMKALPIERWHTSSADSLMNSIYKNFAKEEADLFHQYYIYAEMLLYAGKSEEALAFLEERGNLKKHISKHPDLFIQLYLKNNKPLLALDILSNIIRSGNGSLSMKSLLQDIWTQAYGNQQDFEAYYQEQLNYLRKEKEIGLSDRMLSYKAPDFELLDLSGNIVSLHSLKGKVVFLDFWATWCGPCLASFPTMQRVLDRYKDNDDVAFLFVNTMERNMDSDLREQKITEILKSKELGFQVVLDQKTGPQYELIQKYKVKSLPAQFIIDKFGNVRFELKGFDGKSDGLLEEIDLLVQHTLKIKE